jgi:hypothetical protein
VTTTVTYAAEVGAGTARVRVRLPDVSSGGTGAASADAAEVETRIAYPAPGPVLSYGWPARGEEVAALRASLGALAHRVDAAHPVHRLWVHAPGSRPMVWRWPAEPEPGPLRQVRRQLDELGRLPLLHAMAETLRAAALAASPEAGAAATAALRTALGALEAMPVPDDSGIDGAQAAEDPDSPPLAVVARIVADRIDARLRLLGLARVTRGWRP